MTMTLVSTVTVGSGGAASIEFTNIPQTGKDLLLVLSTRMGAVSTGNTSTFRLNSDTTGSNYAYRVLRGNGSTADSDSGSGFFVLANPSDATANTFTNQNIYISNYASTTTKSFSADMVTENNATAASAWIGAGRYTTSSGITTVTVISQAENFVQNSTASLYLIS